MLLWTARCAMLPQKSVSKLKPIIDKSLPSIKLVLRNINHARRVKQLSSIFCTRRMENRIHSFLSESRCTGVKELFNGHLHPFTQSISIRVRAESLRMSTRNAAQSSVSRKECKKKLTWGCKKNIPTGDDCCRYAEQYS